ncbi:hypothetical protein ACLOJK_008191 [Asimina triloba]
MVINITWAVGHKKALEAKIKGCCHPITGELSCVCGAIKKLSIAKRNSKEDKSKQEAYAFTLLPEPSSEIL